MENFGQFLLKAFYVMQFSYLLKYTSLAQVLSDSDINITLDILIRDGIIHVVHLDMIVPN